MTHRTLGFVCLGASVALLPAGCGRGASAQAAAQTYARACQACHQADGRGTPGVAPPLAGRAGRLARTKDGRRYVVSVVLFGLAGDLPADGAPFAGPMPPASFLSDDEVASVVRYVLTSWGNAADLPEGFEPIAPAEVARLRASNVSPLRLAAERPR